MKPEAAKAEAPRLDRAHAMGGTARRRRVEVALRDRGSRKDRLHGEVTQGALRRGEVTRLRGAVVRTRAGRRLAEVLRAASGAGRSCPS